MLVMVKHDLSRLFEEGEPLDQFEAQQGMILDDLSLNCGQRPVLFQDGIGNPDLPDVVEKRAPLYVHQEIPVRDAQFPGQQKRIISNELGVADRVLIVVRGGDEMDEAIIEYIKRKHKLAIGTYEAEEIKISIGSAIPMNERMTFTARGKNMVFSIWAAVPRPVPR